MVRNDLWPVPTIGIVVGLIGGIVIPRLDEAFDRHLPAVVAEHLFGGGALAARTLLGAVASSLITVTALTFSLTVVTLQLASGQFSPRLLRSFTRDRWVHVTLALLLGTFTYALAVLRTVRSAGEGEAAFVPQMAVTLGFALCIASVLGLVLFLAHLASEIRVETIFRRVHRDADATLRNVADQTERPSTRDVPRAPDGAAALVAPQSGFLLSVDGDALAGVAERTESIISIERTPGDLLVAGTPIGRVWAGAAAPGPQQLEQIARTVETSMWIGFERTEEQDLAYGLRQLADVVAKALSPGVNDPTTAIHGLGHIAALLCDLAQHPLGPVVLTDSHDEPRVVLARSDFAELLDIGVTQARHYGAGDPFVAAALMRLLRDVAWRTRSQPQADAVRTQKQRLRESIDRQEFDSTERERLDIDGRRIEQALDGQWHHEAPPA